MDLVSITPTDDVLARYGNMIGALGEGRAHKGLARAVNRVTKTVHSRTVREVAKQISLPAKRVREEIHTRQADPKGRTALEGVVYASGRPLPLSEFNPKQFSWGVRARVWGRMQRFPTTFIYAGHWKNRSAPIAGDNVFQNTQGFSERSQRNNALEKMFGPSIPEEMVRDKSREAFYRTVAEMLPARVSHELSRLLPD